LGDEGRGRPTRTRRRVYSWGRGLEKAGKAWKRLERDCGPSTVDRGLAEHAIQGICRLAVGDTANWQSALRGPSIAI